MRWPRGAPHAAVLPGGWGGVGAAPHPEPCVFGVDGTPEGGGLGEAAQLDARRVCVCVCLKSPLECNRRPPNTAVQPATRWRRGRASPPEGPRDVRTLLQRRRELCLFGDSETGAVCAAGFSACALPSGYPVVEVRGLGWGWHRCHCCAAFCGENTPRRRVTASVGGARGFPGGPP